MYSLQILDSVGY